MKKITNSIYDIIAFSNGIIYTRKTVLENGSVKVNFYGYDIKRMQNTPVTKSVYLLNKFGPEYKKISEQLGDYVSCDADITADKHTIVVYETGETGIFSSDGDMIWSCDINYHGCEVNGVAVDGNQFWSVVPDKNCIVSYSIAHKKFSMRIGSLESPSFNHPVSISRYDSDLYVCNTESCKIRKISLKDFSVSDYKSFDEPVYKYLRSCGKEIFVLESGVYI
ncbi:MAG: hypothetical protein IJZ16_03120 [Clostridia bacterium]|nr:hypothetical protein [Clostridia bacterium]